VPSADSEPVPLGAPTIPGVGLWSDSDPPTIPVTTPIAFSGLVATPTDRAIPTIGHIGRYALKYQLGEGGLGTVFAAHDPLLSRLIAVKTLNVKVPEAERESFNALFLNEARAAGGLSHPHIVTVFDAGISDERAYIAMELLKGRDLRQLRQEGWRATPAQAALIIRRVADALAFAHSKGVIHRDIKPANIFMVGRTQPRVLDFGIARVAHQQDYDDPHSGAGSPYYMAPEQVRRDPSDRRTDVFSLGVVLYELLTHVKPFRGESLAQIRDAVLNHEPPLANKVDPAVPKTLAAIVARAMAKDPEQRFRSARSFARELRQWLDENPTSADGEKTAPSLAPPARRSRVLIGAAVAAGVAAVMAAVATWFVLMPPAPTSSDTPATASEARSTRPAVPDVVVPMAVPAERAPATIAAAAPVTRTEPMSMAPATEATIVASLGVPTPAIPSLLSPQATTSAMTSPAAPRAPTPAAPTLTAAPTDGAAAQTTDVKPTALPAPPLPATPPRESAKDKKARETREREARENEARVAAAARLVAPATGTVKIAISPWGLVEVDGASSGAAPPITELTLGEGRHQIVIRNGDNPPHTVTVNVIAGQTISVRHKFGS